jgi:hypothetical protein
VISQTDLEAFLGLAAGTDTDLLVELEAAAVAWLQGQTNRYFGATAAQTVILEGNGTQDLYLPEPITAVSSVLSQSFPGGTQTAITAGGDDGFEIRDMHLARKGGYRWSRRTEYVVTYTRGYTQSDAGPPANIAAPDDIRHAVKQIVSFWYMAGKPWEGASQKTSETFGNYAYTRGALFAAPEAMLNGIPGLRQTINAWYLPRI